MYISDYAYSAEQNYWGTNYKIAGIDYKTSWLMTSYDEWFLTPYKQSDNNYLWYKKSSGGGLYGGYGSYSSSVVPTKEFFVRPVFYLKDTVKYITGEGTRKIPYRIS